MKKKNGFTLVELLATLIILGIVVGISIIAVNSSYAKAKKQTENVFVKTLDDALDIYISNDASKQEYNTYPFCIVDKTHRIGVNIYEATNSGLTFNGVINSSLSPLDISDVVNPANEDVTCSVDGAVRLFRDDDRVYYYAIKKSDFECLLETGANIGEVDSSNLYDTYITNLPKDCANCLNGSCIDE